MRFGQLISIEASKYSRADPIAKEVCCWTGCCQAQEESVFAHEFHHKALVSVCVTFTRVLVDSHLGLDFGLVHVR